MSVLSTTAPLHLWLDRGEASRALVGGKGASLSTLHALGAPVPPAFALTTVAYAAFAAALGLPRRSGDVPLAELPALRQTIMAAPLPVDVSVAVAEGFAALREQLGDDLALAVRSSATAEDGAAYSFAGQHDTILDVRTLPDLAEAIKQCWASLWSERAVDYRRAHHLDSDEVAIAVVVQQMIQSDVSFVVFTSDPVSGHAQRLVISAAWGLGEALVSGLVAPDHVVVGADGDVLEYQIGDKQVMVIPGATAGEGPREVAVPRALRTMPALSHGQASSIAAMARALAARLGYSADLEGAIARDTPYLFQVRPITTLAPTGA